MTNNVKQILMCMTNSVKQILMCMRIYWIKKSLKMSTGLSEAVNLKRADNAMAKRKRRKSDLQNTTQKTID